MNHEANRSTNPDQPDAAHQPKVQDTQLVSRRAVLFGGLGTAGAVAVGTVWWAARPDGSPDSGQVPNSASPTPTRAESTILPPSEGTKTPEVSKYPGHTRITATIFGIGEKPT